MPHTALRWLLIPLLVVAFALPVPGVGFAQPVREPDTPQATIVWTGNVNTQYSHR